MNAAHPSTKAEWRSWARARRAKLNRDAWQAGLTQQLERHPILGREGWIASYLALPDEPDLDALHAKFPGRIAAPRIQSNGGHMTMHALATPLERHPFGVRQPPASSSEIPSRAIIAVLVPGLLFDLNGVRLGRGGGYYDRWLASVPDDVPRIGVTHECLIMQALPYDTHDVSMHHLATENQVLAI